MRLPRLVRIGCTLVTVSLLVAGCGHGIHLAAASGDRTELRVGVLDAVDCATAYIAQDHGYFAAEGLNVSIQTMPPDSRSLSLLQRGDVDIAFDDYVDLFGAVAHGAKTHIAADAYQLAPEVQPILAPPTSSIRTPRDLAGKRIGVPAASNVQPLLINELVRAYGVDPGSLRYVPAPLARLGQALAHGGVDAVSMSEPFTTEVESAYGAHVVADIDTGATRGMPLSGYVTTQPWAATHKSAMASFRRAMQRAAADAAQRAVVEGVLTRYEHVDQRTAAIVHFGVFPISVNAARLQRVVDLMTETGALSQPIDLKAMTS